MHPALVGSSACRAWWTSSPENASPFADVSQPSWKVVAALSEIASSRGLPQRLIIDNGPDFVPKAPDAWAHAHGVELHFTRRGTPVSSCYVESFHDKLRDECLSMHWFRGLPDARRVIEAWQEDYNTVRPHSTLGGGTPPGESGEV